MKLLVVLMLCVIILCTCGKSDTGSQDNHKFVGSWQCADAPLEHPDYYTGYLMWAVNEDDFDPPVTWDDMEETQKLTYEFVTDKELRLSFVYEDGKSTLVFTKME